MVDSCLELLKRHHILAPFQLRKSVREGNYPLPNSLLHLRDGLRVKKEKFLTQAVKLHLTRG